ncbi:MAG: hypothetical protein MUF87_21110 [Anaerolineae bacterium]|nr:hypothetical protein [Anaerolineae bacterium]
MKVFLLGLGLALLLTACDGWQPSLTPISQTEVEAFIGAPLPTDARDLQATTTTGIDTLMVLRFDAPADQVDAWVNALGFTVEGRLNVPPWATSSHDEITWWQPYETESYVSYSELINGRSYKLVIVPQAADRVVVYLEVFTL